MEPQQVFKRRHFNTPESFTLIMTNYIVVAVGLFYLPLRIIKYIGFFG